MKRLISVFVAVFVFLVVGYGQQVEKVKTIKSQWNKKRVAFLGDSMTQKWQRGDTPRIVFWEYLEKILDIEPYVYGISGHQWTGVYGQAQKLKKEHDVDVDAIIIFAGTNDYMHDTPIGKFYNETAKETNFNGITMVRKYRTPDLNDTTFCGRINKVMSFLKNNYPDQQIVIMTPIHRAFATFKATNVQPEESFANGLGLYLDEYVKVLREAASVWAVPLIDLYSVSGLYPMADSQAKYFMSKKTDLLHPGSLGNMRLAKTINYKLMSLPATFTNEN